LLGVHFVVVELNFSRTQLPCVATSLRTVLNRQRQKIFFKMFSADYPSSPTPSEADMDAMTAHVENRPYHEAFMREAINMVRLFPTKHRSAFPMRTNSEHANSSIQAELALASDETPVGCVFVHDGKVIAQGMNGTNVTMNVSKQECQSNHHAFHPIRLSTFNQHHLL
jgi:hypothetical protein